MQRGGAAALLALTVLLGLAVPAGAWTRPADRLAGADRYETSVVVSRAGFPSGSGAVVVASGDAATDALVAGPLAVLVGGPVLLASADVLPAQTADELARLQPRQLFVVGGTVSLSDSVAAAASAAAGVPAHRVAGADRYATATAVASLFPAAVGSVVVAGGTAPADAVAGGGFAARDRSPLLLTAAERLPPAVAAELRRLQPTEAVVAGGLAAVSDDVVAAMAAIVPTRRVAGPDRYATSAALAAVGWPSGAPSVVLAGPVLADALSAVPLAAGRAAPLVLTPTGCGAPGVVSLLQGWRWPDVTVVGGSATVSPAAAQVVPCEPVADGMVASGVTLTTHVLAGPQVVRVLTVDRALGLEVVAATATGRVSGRGRLTDTARRWNAIAAVNGDFFLGSGVPVHALASRSRLLRLPGFRENQFGLAPVGTTPPGHIGPPEPAVVLERDDEDLLAVARVNDGGPQGAELVLLTTERPGVVATAPSCVAPLRRVGGAPHVNRQRYEVRSVWCAAESVPVGEDDVLVAREGTAAAETLAALTPGAAVGVRWSLAPAGQVLTDVMGANLTLVHDGAVSPEIVGRTEPFFAERAPRTAAGWLADGRIVLVTVDGRQSGWSVGMTPLELARTLVALGVHEAANLDGGGSTTMAVGGVLANRPSDAAGERAIGPSLLVVPSGAPEPPPAVGLAAATAEAESDGASYGGWLALRR